MKVVVSMGVINMLGLNGFEKKVVVGVKKVKGLGDFEGLWVWFVWNVLSILFWLI